MFADGIGKQVTVAEARETGALGAAMGAAIAAGIHDGYESAVAAMSRPRATFTPDSAMRAHYDRRYAIWNRITQAMEPIWLDLAGRQP